MHNSNYTTLNYSGIYQTKIEKQDDGTIIVIQTNKHGHPDVVLLDRQMIADIALMDDCSRSAA